MSSQHRTEDGHQPTKANQPESKAEEKPKEIGGPAGHEPTRFGDWEKAGRCSDF